MDKGREVSWEDAMFEAVHFEVVGRTLPGPDLSFGVYAVMDQAEVDNLVALRYLFFEMDRSRSSVSELEVIQFVAEIRTDDGAKEPTTFQHVLNRNHQNLDSFWSELCREAARTLCGKRHQTDMKSIKHQLDGFVKYIAGTVTASYAFVGKAATLIALALLGLITKIGLAAFCQTYSGLAK